MIRNILILASIILFVNTYSIAQLTGENCSNPKAVSIVCPTTVSFTSETTSGYSNDISSFGSLSTPGNDRVYEISVPSGSVNILVSITSTTSSFYLILTGNSCTPGTSYSQWIYGARNNVSFPISGSGPYYLWVDNTSSTNVTYDISFGVKTSVTYTDSRGSWGFDYSGCTSPMTKSNFNITYNSSQMYIPITYSPLSTPGIVCGSIYLKNTTGQEGVKSFVFEFGTDLSSVSPTVTSMAGFYNSGTWNATTSGSTVTWTFSDAAGLGYGDFTGSPNSCLKYTFCFNMTPLSNDPIGTNITFYAYPDGKGAPSSTGCCATSTSCSIGAGSASSGISGAFNDPALPAADLKLKLTTENGVNTILWQTEYSKDIVNFDIQRSFDKSEFIDIGQVEAAGTENEINEYSFKDFITNREVYYRIKVIKKDGSESYSNICEVYNELSEIKIYPQPVSGYFTIDTPKPIHSVSIKDVLDNLRIQFNNQLNQYDISSLPSGIYFIHINLGDQVVIRKVIKE